ncbi:MAG: response regulator, partial [Deltaproteobacteria bacterium]|nr:response regulator [Deltaproteobacteria bacterium]
MGDNKTILIVDDCDTTRKILATMVKSSGFNAIVAINGLDALEKMVHNDVALVVTDLNMPQMDGIELVKNIRADSKYQKVPIIMITT